MNAQRTFHNAHKSVKRALHLHMFFVTYESKIIALPLAFSIVLQSHLSGSSYCHSVLLCLFGYLSMPYGTTTARIHN